jgi:cyclohexanecarboxylate-CoA ligase
LHGHLDAVADRLPDRLALSDGDTRLTYAELRHRTKVVAASLRERGLPAGDAVLVNLPCWWESIVISYAALRVGAVVAHVIPAAGRREIGDAIDQTNPRLIFTARGRGPEDHVDVVRSLAPTAEVVGVRPGEAAVSSFESFMTGTIGPEPDAGDADAAAVVLFTSGTTSGAKGVIHTHNTLRAEARSINAMHGCDQDDVFLVAMQIGHIGGLIYSTLLPAECGGCAVLQDSWSAERALALIRSCNVTVFPGVPAFQRSLVDLPTFTSDAMASVRLFAVGGSRVTAASVREAAAAFGCWAKRGYGSTEVPTATNSSSTDDPAIWSQTDGRPVPHMQVRITDSGEPVPLGHEGEIELFGPEMFQGYVDATLNQDAFTDDGWFRTGDLGRLGALGAVTVTGRIKDLIIRGGENISAQELEELILEVPGIEDVAVVGVPDRRLGERVCAVVVSPAQIVTLERIVEHLRSRGIARFKLPERLEIREQLPRTSAGKIRKVDLRGQLADCAEPVDQSARRSPG